MQFASSAPPVRIKDCLFEHLSRAKLWGMPAGMPIVTPVGDGFLIRYEEPSPYFIDVVPSAATGAEVRVYGKVLRPYREAIEACR